MPVLSTDVAEHNQMEMNGDLNANEEVLSNLCLPFLGFSYCCVLFQRKDSESNNFRKK